MSILKDLIIEDLGFKYGDRGVITSFNLTTKTQQKIGLLGPNGSGKTTLFGLITGLLTPTSGRIYLGEQLIIPGQFHPEIGLAFQNPADQLFCSTVEEDVSFGPHNMGLTGQALKDRVQEALTISGTTHLRDRCSHELSGGEKCMVAIATILAMGPEVMLFDEPDANLDLKARRRLINFLAQCPQTLIISSHDLELILEVCDRVIILNQGQIQADGDPQELLSNEDLMITNNLEVPRSLGFKP